MNKQSRVVLAAVLVATLTPTLYLVTRLVGAHHAQTVTLSRPTTSFDWQAGVRAYAGAGLPGLLDGPSARAQFSDPYGIAIDSHGNVYVADAGDNNVIRKITPAGMVSTLAGAGEGYADGTAARFNTPSGLAIDAGDNLYLADTGNNMIRRIDPQGRVTTLAGDGKPGYRDGAAQQAEFNGPIGVAVDAQGNVYVADTYNDRIRKIAPDGQVSSLAGSGVPGFADGQGGAARFDTPCALTLNAHGELIVADTRNNALRRIDRTGQVTTLYRGAPDDREASFKRPVSLAITPDDTLYVGTMKGGQVFQFAPSGAMRSLNDPDRDLSVPGVMQIPYGLALTAQGQILATDAPAFVVRLLAPVAAESPAPTLRGAQVAAGMVAPPAQRVLWPLAPQHSPHEIVGTIGEDRGNDKGASRDHFHAGLDLRANMGTTVLSVSDGKVSDPLAAWGYGKLSEGLSVGVMNYIHMRVGRDQNNVLLDPRRFQAVTDDQNQPRIRVRRGTRFASGDALGSVNRMFHVHLEYAPFGAAVNPLVLGLPGYADKIAPHIESIRLIDRQGRTLAGAGRQMLRLDRQVGALRIVVAAYDQADGNEARRRLGLYKLGYQILHKNGEPSPGFAQPRMNIEFNQLPGDKAIKIAYADGSGETVHGNKVTQFLYGVTSTLRDGGASPGFWDPAALPRGDYLIRIYAADFAGNVALAGRDLPFTMQ